MKLAVSFSFIVLTATFSFVTPATAALSLPPDSGPRTGLSLPPEEQGPLNPTINTASIDSLEEILAMLGIQIQ